MVFNSNTVSEDSFYLILNVIEDDIEAVQQALRLQHLIVKDLKQDSTNYCLPKDKDKAFES